MQDSVDFAPACGNPIDRDCCYWWCTGAQSCARQHSFPGSPYFDWIVHCFTLFQLMTLACSALMDLFAALCSWPLSYCTAWSLLCVYNAGGWSQFQGQPMSSNLGSRRGPATWATTSTNLDMHATGSSNNPKFSWALSNSYWDRVCTEISHWYQRLFVMLSQPLAIS